MAKSRFLLSLVLAISNTALLVSPQASAALEPPSITYVVLVDVANPGDDYGDIYFTAAASGDAPYAYAYSDDNGATWRVRAAGYTASPIRVTKRSGSESNLKTTRAQFKICAISFTTFEIFGVGNRMPGFNCSNASPVSEVALGLPTAPSITSVTQGNGTLTVNFSAPGSNGGSAITKYQKAFCSSAPCTPTEESYSDVAQTDTTPISFGSLTNGTSYGVCIRAFNANGAGIENCSTGTPRTTPGAPTITGVTAGDQSLSVAFTAGTTGGATIQTYAYSTDNSNWTTITPNSTASPIVITGLTNGTLYNVYIAAVNAAGRGTGASSSGTPSVIQLSTPLSPTISVTPNTSRSINVSWSAVTDAISYTLKVYNMSNTLICTVTVGNVTSRVINPSNCPAIQINTNYKVGLIATAAGYSNSNESATSTAPAPTIIRGRFDARTRR